MQTYTLKKTYIGSGILPTFQYKKDSWYLMSTFLIITVIIIIFSLLPVKALHMNHAVSVMVNT